jgi:hypothetical protein
MYKVTISRVYEFEEELFNFLNKEEDKEEKAITMAMNLFADEVIYFENSINDFVSAKIEKI